MKSQTITTREVMKITGYCRPMIYEFIKSGDLPAYRLGKRKDVFIEEEVIEFIKRRRILNEREVDNG